MPYGPVLSEGVTLTPPAGVPDFLQISVERRASHERTTTPSNRRPNVFIRGGSGARARRRVGTSAFCTPSFCYPEPLYETRSTQSPRAVPSQIEDTTLIAAGSRVATHEP